jgi:arsenate reductase
VSIAIYHNPNCQTSRNTLAMLKQTGEPVHVIDYLQTGWTKPQLLGLFAAAGLTPREALRVTNSPAEDLGLTQADVSDDTLLEAMVAHPILVNRPIVCTPKGVRLCRPSETLFELVAKDSIGPFTKEDGTIVIDASGKRMA